ncbi:uncharacterized protein LOC106358899 [Brassica napus]|uniref:uncharacterized protein LOC106358899 n=1 Tax=Brassica napus TaxID=3708 RepID=UPI002078A561|nr:uncharacterized protein LOC106358899 [Brassica napus]
MNEELITIPSTAEIRTALFSIHPDKAPGPDGFSACFFQSNWDVIGPGICKEIQDFSSSGTMRDSTNQTYVRLIPKITGAKLVSDYRPIALCNVMYKIISMILSLRLKPVLQSLIGETQSAFIKGRAISDNVLITHELLHNLKTSEAKVNCSMAVKTDMSKAYDRLEQLGYNETWVDWIMSCISTVSYSFLIDDTVHGRVTPSRGIRQGDPLSPYIFILCREVLSGLCRKAHISGHMVGLRVARAAPCINHLLFADDTMFFLKTDMKSCAALKNILGLYETGNTVKKLPSYESPYFVLCACSHGWRGILAARDLLCEKLEAVIGDGEDTRVWKDRWLSTDMARAPVGPAPEAFQDLRVADLLTRDSKEWKIQLIEHILPHHLAEIRLLKPSKTEGNDGLYGKYCQKASFLRVSLLCACSHGWRGILAGRDLLCEKLEAVIGDGEDTRVWKDRWLSTDMARAPVGPAPEAFQDLRVADLLTRDSKEWKIQLIEQILPHHLAEIRLLKPSKTGGNDGVVWLGARSGIYSTRSGYFAAAKLENQRHTPQSRINWKALLWTGRVSPKLQVFLWKITQGALPVGANSQLRGMLHNTACPRCDMLETVLHLFLHCDYAKKVWASSLFSLHFDPDNFTDITAFSDALKHCKSSVCLPPLRILSYIFPWVCWSLWTARNKLIFEDRKISHEESVSKAISNAREWNSAQSVTSPPPEPRHKMLNIPDQDVLTLGFSDVAWNKETNTAAYGCIFFNKEGQIIHQESCVERHVSSPLTAEALALRWTINKALSRGYNSICFNTDCRSLLVAITSRPPPAEFFGIIQDIDFLSFNFAAVSFKFI